MFFNHKRMPIQPLRECMHKEFESYETFLNVSKKRKDTLLTSIQGT